MSATAMTSEAFIGGKIDDLFKALVVKAKGDVQTARFGIAFTDEWDAKAAEGLSVGGHTSGGNGREANTLCIQQEFLVPMQGAEFIISGKRSMERPIMFDSRGTFFAFAGAFAGLSELIRKKNGQACIGFATPAGTRTKKREYILDAISEYGYLKTWTNRLSALIFLPDPTQRSLEIAASHGVLDSTNAILGELGIQLFPHPNAIPRMAEFALESRAFYRGLKSVWWSLAESAVSAGAKGTVMVTAADVDAAIARVSSGSAGLTDKPGQATQPTQEESNADDFLAGGSAGG
jgi:ATP-dependent protease Clp ATPase subunit